MMTAAHKAMGTGFTMTHCQLVSTAWRRPTRRSSSSGMATTLEAKMGAAIKPPISSQSSNSQP